eukprot:scaffold71917_cov75-Phaeocystis_antarctica.AAC.1
MSTGVELRASSRVVSLARADALWGWVRSMLAARRHMLRPPAFVSVRCSVPVRRCVLLVRCVCVLSIRHLSVSTHRRARARTSHAVRAVRPPGHPHGRSGIRCGVGAVMGNLHCRAKQTARPT